MYVHKRILIKSVTIYELVLYNGAIPFKRELAELLYPGNDQG